MSPTKRKSDSEEYPGPEKKAVPEGDLELPMDRTQEDEEAPNNTVAPPNPQIFDPSLDEPFSPFSDKSDTDLSPIEVVRPPPSLPPPSPPRQSPITPRRSRSEPSTPTDGEPLTKKIKFPADLMDIRDRSKRESIETRQIFKESYQDVVDMSKVTERSEGSQRTSPVLTPMPIQRAEVMVIPQNPPQAVEYLNKAEVHSAQMVGIPQQLENVELLAAEMNHAQLVAIPRNLANVQILDAQRHNGEVMDIVVAPVQIVQFAAPPPPPPARELDDLNEDVAGPPPPAAPPAPQQAPIAQQQPPQIVAPAQPPQVAAPAHPPQAAAAPQIAAPQQVAAPQPPSPPPSSSSSSHQDDWVEEVQKWLDVIQRCFDAVIRGPVTNQTIDGIQSLTRCRSTLRRWLRAEPADSDDKMDKMIQRVSRAMKLVPKLKK